MNIMDLWNTGQATAEEAARRRTARWDEPAPVPAQLLGGMIHPLTNFNRPGGDPVQQAADLGLFGISPFRGRMTTAPVVPRMTRQEALWSRAQQGDIHATGQLTGEMFQRDISDLPGPPAPEPVFQNDAWAELEGRGFPDDMKSPWQKYEETVNELPPDELKRLNDSLDATVPPDMIEDMKKEFRGGMDYLPPEGSVPPRGFDDELGRLPWEEEDMREALRRQVFEESRVPYDEWQEMLRRMNVSPNVLPRINPFGKQ